MNLFGQKFQNGVLCDPITAIVGGISAVTSIIGGAKKASAAKSAAQLQADAADAAGKKVEDVTAATNPAILAAGKAAGDQAIGAGTEANKLLNPYATAGSTAADVLNKGIAEGGDFNKTPTMADLQIDPGYAFRAQQGEQALERSAAAHGAVGGGGFQKDLATFSQGLASQEYQAAFDRFERATQNRFANVSGVANLGRGAAGEMGTNLIGTNEYAGNANIHATDETSRNTIDAARTAADYATQGANAQAAGKVAASNAIWGGIGGAANTALGTVMATRPAVNYINPWGGLNNGRMPLPPGVTP